VDRSKYSKKEFPSQTENRKTWIIETIRANQNDIGHLLLFITRNDFDAGRTLLKLMKKQDRDAILLGNGILTEKQRAELGSDQQKGLEEPEGT